jgi:hypothetical protein
MKSFFSLALIAVATADDVWDDEHSRVCHTECNHRSNNEFVAMQLEKSCEHYRYVMPRPTVYRFCSNSFNDALEKNCIVACDGNYGHQNSENEAHRNCKEMKNQVPRPLSYKAR